MRFSLTQLPITQNQINLFPIKNHTIIHTNIRINIHLGSKMRLNPLIYVNTNLISIKYHFSTLKVLQNPQVSPNKGGFHTLISQSLQLLIEHL